MGLKTNIMTALLQNLNPNKDENFKLSPEGEKKIDELSLQLAMAIRDFILEQEFTITSLNASQLGIATPFGPIPIVTVKIDENTQAADNPLSGVESMTSIVKLKSVKQGSFD
jgi:hypothetical protein|tara:strand:+ start:360 stop:695 length:336 start_codon:yes stop_codon:yes gene_type:complete